nr:LIM domain-containing protein A-like [Penaeus vannamei]
MLPCVASIDPLHAANTARPDPQRLSSCRLVTTSYPRDNLIPHLIASSSQPHTSVTSSQRPRHFLILPSQPHTSVISSSQPHTSVTTSYLRHVLVTTSHLRHVLTTSYHRHVLTASSSPHTFITTSYLRNVLIASVTASSRHSLVTHTSVTSSPPRHNLIPHVLTVLHVTTTSYLRHSSQRPPHPHTFITTSYLRHILTTSSSQPHTSLLSQHITSSSNTNTIFPRHFPHHPHKFLLLYDVLVNYANN